MHKIRHEIVKEQKQPAFGKNVTTISLACFGGASLLRRRQKSFEHYANLLRHFERRREIPWQKLEVIHRDPSTSLRTTDGSTITTSSRGTSSYRTARNRRAFRRCRLSAWEFQAHPGSLSQRRLCRCRRVLSRSDQ